MFARWGVHGAILCRRPVAGLSVGVFDSVDAWAFVCRSLGLNNLEAEGGKAIGAGMQHTPNMTHLE